MAGHDDGNRIALHCASDRLRGHAAAAASFGQFGGDRGFVVPELNAHALRKLHADVPAGCCGGRLDIKAELLELEGVDLARFDLPNL